MKIHIIGCSGSGKTYLANALSKKYNISHFDLDDIQWDNNAKEYGKKRTLDERKTLLHEILYNNDEWIVEGVYYAWVQQSFDEADKIYVLDMPGYLYKSRIIMRSIKRKLGIQKGKRETLKSVYNLLKWTETFQDKNLKEIRILLSFWNLVTNNCLVKFALKYVLSVSLNRIKVKVLSLLAKKFVESLVNQPVLNNHLN